MKKLTNYELLTHLTGMSETDTHVHNLEPDTYRFYSGLLHAATFLQKDSLDYHMVDTVADAFIALEGLEEEMEKRKGEYITQLLEELDNHDLIVPTLDHVTLKILKGDS